MKLRALVLIALILVFAVAGCSPRAGARPAREAPHVNNAMGFNPNLHFAPKYLAIERG